MNRLAMTIDQQDRCRELAGQGYTLSAIAERMGCSRSTVHYAVKGRQGPGYRYLQALEVFRVLCRYGDDVATVASDFGVTEYAIKRIWSLASGTSKAVWREHKASILAAWRAA